MSSHPFRALASIGWWSVLAASVLFRAPSPAQAQSGAVVVSSDTAWVEGTYSLDSLTVQNGATLTIAGGSTVTVTGSVVVSGASRILLAGKNTGGLVGGQWAGEGVTMLAASLHVEGGGRLSADAQGYTTFLGPGGSTSYTQGGTHGGRGTANPRATYGSYLAPGAPGSAGGGAYGGESAGGGAIRLIVTGTLTNEGTISANGWASASGNNGGGSGGSIHVTAGALTGAGSFTANGTQGNNGAGGGGRIAIHYGSDAGFTRSNVVAAAGGAGSTAGSVYLLENGTNLYVPTALALPPDTNASYGTLTVEQGATLALGGGSTLSVTGALLVTGGSTLLVQAKNNTGRVDNAWQGAGCTITAASVQVDGGSRISADGQGYGTYLGPGGGPTYVAGGTHGGKGIDNTRATYGSYSAPVDLGSGGGGEYGGASAGGGAVRLIVSGTLTNNGTISANGWASAGGNNGGGSGGSAYVTAATLAGSGTVSADGAQGVNGAGGGGRVAVYYAANGGFNLNAVTARAGGTGAGNGTVYLIEDGTDLTVTTNLGLPPDTAVSYARVTIANGGLLTLGGGSTLTVTGALLVTGHSTLLVQSKNNTGRVDNTWQGAGGAIAAESVQVDAGSRISADGQGYGTYLGPGGGPMYVAGGTHGGQGSDNTRPVYGSLLEPVDLGSGGGGEYGGASAGGGAVRLTVTGTLTNDGTISANGWATAGGNNGGGSGGSIFARVGGLLAGAGAFRADGVQGANGAGGGGRVAIYYATSAFDHANVTANAGGAGATAGTVALVVSPPTLTSVTPAAGPVGTAVTLTGTGFTWATEVRFNGIVQPTFTKVSDTQITVAVPPGAPTGPVQVETAGGTATSASSFTVVRYALSLWALGSGEGDLSTNIAGLSVAKSSAALAQATADLDPGTAVTITATPVDGSVFAGWSGGADCSDGAVTMLAPTTCVATFTLSPPAIDTFVPGLVMVNPGQRTWVEWDVAPGADAALDGQAVAGAGSVSVAPSRTTSYRLAATGAGGTRTAVVTIHVRDGALALGTPVVTAPRADEVIRVAGVTLAWTPVGGVGGYDLRIFSSTTGQTVFSGSLAGAASTSTLIALPNGAFTFAVRACTTDFTAASCGPWGTVDFRVQLAAPAASPAMTSPAAGAVIAESTNTFSWTAVAGAASYEVTIRRAADLRIVTHVRASPPDTSTVVTLPSGQYVIAVQACQSACSPPSPLLPFTIELPPPPTDAPVIIGAVVSGNVATTTWTSVPGAQLYRVELVQPAPAGPGGGSLTIASRQTTDTVASFPVPAGLAYVLVRACNGDGCGPLSASVPLESHGENPAAPQIGTPMSVVDVQGPVVLLSWSRVPGDTGDNTWYRLYVQDLARAAAALDVLTMQNYYGASFMAEGTRYDAIVTAAPGTPQEVTGPPVGFVVTGTSSLAPTMVAPTHQSTVGAGNVYLGWTPVAGGTLYEYYVAVRGQPRATVRGVTTGLFVQVPLTVPAEYSGIVRACPAEATCTPDSDAGWGPWSIHAGPGVTNFRVH